MRLWRAMQVVGKSLSFPKTKTIDILFYDDGIDHLKTLA